MTFAEFGFDSWPLAPDVARKCAPAPTEGAKFALVPAEAATFAYAPASEGAKFS